jgi:pre-60S factor REI1
MQYKHSLFIPERQHLVVDEEALVKYCHLVVFGYFECLYCGSQRNTAQAAQQHMVGKGHCRINLDREGSEFRDFYDFNNDGADSDSGGELDEDEEDSNDEDEEEDNVSAETSFRRSKSAAPVQLDAHSLRLVTGKVLTHRSQAARLRAEKHHARQKRIEAALEVSSPAHPKNTTPTPSQQPQDTTSPDQVPESKRLAKMTAKFDHHLTTMRAQDRLALAHLPTYQQRALVAKSKAQVEHARKAENEMLLKIQLQANKTLKG